MKSFRQSIATKLVLCKLIGQFYFGVISCETSKCLIVLTDSLLCKYVVSRSICKAQAGDVIG